MFQNLRIGNPFYVLYKGEPRLSIGEVRSAPKPTPQIGLPYQQGMIPQTMNQLEIKVSMDSQDILFTKVPAELSITDYGPDMVISDNRDAITNEIEAMKRASEKHIADTPRHEKIVTECDDMLGKLNPGIVKNIEQERRIEILTSELADIKGMLSDLLGHGSKNIERNESHDNRGKEGQAQ